MVTATDQPQTSIRIERSVVITAPIQLAYESLLEQLGPASGMPDGTPMPMKFEAWPGGRWFRDLGEGAGHFWGTVQVIKPPTLIEINGPLFMSYPVMSHIQYRLIEKGETTTLQFLHQAFGNIDPSHAEHVAPGWQHQIERIKQRAEQTA